jgi:hypothetical protein
LTSVAGLDRGNFFLLQLYKKLGRKRWKRIAFYKIAIIYPPLQKKCPRFGKQDGGEFER